MFSHKITEDAELRLIEPHHAEELFSLIDSNREHLRKWLPWVDGTRSADDSRAFIKQQLHQLADNGSIVAGIWYDGYLAGTIGLHSVDAKFMDIGYWLGETFQGKGLVTNACNALINHSFGDLNINRILIRVEPNNDRSRAIPERLGFTYEGTLRQVGKNSDGEFVDLMVYSLLKDEWRAR